MRHRAWVTDRDAEFWVWNFRRIRSQFDQVKHRLQAEESTTVKCLLQEALEECGPILEVSIRRAEQNIELFRLVLSRARERENVRHCDLFYGNVLLGSDGLMIMDLAEVEPSPRIYKDIGGLYSWGDEKTVVLAMITYQEAAQLSREEGELLPIINDPIDSWRRLMDGYLSGDWTEEMLTNYRGNVRDYGRRRERLELVTAALRERVQ